MNCSGIPEYHCYKLKVFHSTYQYYLAIFDSSNHTWLITAGCGFCVTETAPWCNEDKEFPLWREDMVSTEIDIYTHVFSLFCYILSFISFINQNHKIAFTFCNFVSHDFIIWLVITFYGLEYFSIYFNFSEARSKFELWRICITLTAFHFWQRKMSLFYHLIHIWKIYFVIFLFCGNFVISLSIFDCHQLYIKALTEKYGNSLQYARKSCQQR